MRSLAAAASAPPAARAAALALAVGAGTPSAWAAGAPAGALAVGAGKKVAGLPLWICQLSQSMIREKANTTHKMVRRISVMRASGERKTEKTKPEAGARTGQRDRANDERAVAPPRA